jgi:phage terminase small subunit
MLNLKQQRFVKEYIVSLNATQSAINAGYSKHTAQQVGSRLLLNVLIKDEISKQMKLIDDEKIMTASETLQRITEIARSPNAKETDKLKALELMSKRHGLLIDKSEETKAITITLVDDLKNLAD